MLPFQNYYKKDLVDQEQSFFTTNLMNGVDSITSSSESQMIKSQTSKEPCKSHKEAERRRRQRINAHLSTLRSLLPNTIKTDKASLLTEVVQHVNELKKQAADLARQQGDLWCSGGGGLEPESWPFPSELDEASLSYFDGEEAKFVKVTVSCDDRPGLNQDLAMAIRSVRARVVGVEMMTVGGRTKSVVVMEWCGGGEEETLVFKRALKAVVENRAFNYDLGLLGSRSKRVRSSDFVNGFIRDI